MKIERVEVIPGCAHLDQLLAHLDTEVDTVAANREVVLVNGIEALPDIQRHVDAGELDSAVNHLVANLAARPRHLLTSTKKAVNAAAEDLTSTADSATDVDLLLDELQFGATVKQTGMNERLGSWRRFRTFVSQSRSRRPEGEKKEKDDFHGEWSELYVVAIKLPVNAK